MPVRGPCTKSLLHQNSRFCTKSPTYTKVGGSHKRYPAAAVGAMEGHTRRHHVSLGSDVLHREPKVGKGLPEGGEELRPGP